MAIDSHIHVNDIQTKNLENQIEEINNNKNIEAVINIGVNYETSKQSILTATFNPKFYASIGIHPLYIENQKLDFLYHLSLNNKVVAIGEIGLDSTKDNIETQKKYVMEQILIANELKLPVIIHSNNHNKTMINIFKNNIKPEYGCVFHCFQPNIEDLKYLVNNYYYISFAGKITWENAKKSLEIIKKVPNDLFLIETDSPYIKIEPQSSTNPKDISYIIEKIAQIKKMSYEQIDRISTQNTKTLFKKINTKKRG